MLLKVAGALALIVMLLAGCQPVPTPVPPTRPAPTVEETVAIDVSPLPTAATELSPVATDTATGTISATGAIISTANGGNTPIAGIGVRLARVIWNADKTDGAFVLEGATSPGAITDGNGLFAFRDVPAGDYVVVVGDPYGTHEIVSKPDGKPEIYTVPADKAAEWGEIRVNLAP